TPPPFALSNHALGEEGSRPSRHEPPAAAPLGLDDHAAWESRPAAVSAPVALLAADADERVPAIPLREAERLLSDLCTRVEDAELWEQLRSVRDLVREACAMLG